MRVNTKSYLLMSALLYGLTFMGCSHSDEPDVPTPTPEEPTVNISTEIKHATEFIHSVASEIYLWNSQINLSKLDSKTVTDPIATWDDIMYKDDRWSMVTDDYAALSNSTANISTTYGWDVTIFYLSREDNTVCFQVNFVYPNSPAEKAGIRRGDVIIKYNDADITVNNYREVYNSTSGKFGVYYVQDKTLYSKATVDLTAEEDFYEDPVIAKNIFDINGKKVGYIHYAAFVAKSIDPMKEITKEFKAAGVTELILDLRYNGGGLVTAEETLAAMYGPWADTTNRLIYQIDEYNAKYNTAWADDLNHYLNVKEENGKETTYIDQSLNLGLNKIYAIVSNGTASASEGLIVGLMPYMDIEIIGSENTHGKFCTGWVLSGPLWYQMIDQSTPSGISNWGFYVMISRFLNKNRENPCMPDGLTPTINAEDNPSDGYQLGDENETMLAAALQAAGKTGTRSFVECNAPIFETFKHQIRPANFGILVDDRPIAKRQFESLLEME